MPDEGTNSELRSGIVATLDKQLNEALQIGPKIKFFLHNIVRPSMVMGLLKGRAGTPGLVAAASIERNSNTSHNRLSTTNLLELEDKYTSVAYGTADCNNSTVQVLTPIATRTFYILVMGLAHDAGAAGIVELYNTVTGGKLLEMRSDGTAGSAGQLCVTLPKPIPIIPGKIIYVKSSAVGLAATGWVIGYYDEPIA